ncbi:uncharacterized protein LOC106765827 [Vigna radiata var. radiata]|uniref:Uncharacterized protein LOC106765827 n=1 Tax=Vigna radiata var. radiata TaxID=3916 RepID=A0A1S3UJE6_VIGRR|nr:uncharacterized protein LOC106765827 [Vigna radiata var. radiata]
MSPDYLPSAAPTSNSASHTTEEASDLSHGSKRQQGEETSKKLVSQMLAPSSISSASGDFRGEILLMGFCMLLTSFVFPMMPHLMIWMLPDEGSWRIARNNDALQVLFRMQKEEASVPF